MHELDTSYETRFERQTERDWERLERKLRTKKSRKTEGATVIIFTIHFRVKSHTCEVDVQSARKMSSDDDNLHCLAVSEIVTKSGTHYNNSLYLQDPYS